ncbi:hypothetical protein YC2023_048123 [Brassica napus]
MVNCDEKLQSIFASEATVELVELLPLFRFSNATDLSLLHSYPPFTSTALFLMKGSEFYVSPDSGNHDPVTPRLGTFRHVVVQDESLGIIFKRDMTIHLNEELILNTLKKSTICIIFQRDMTVHLKDVLITFKTIDGCALSVHIAGGGGCAASLCKNKCFNVEGMPIAPLWSYGCCRGVQQLEELGPDEIFSYQNTRMEFTLCVAYGKEAVTLNEYNLNSRAPVNVCVLRSWRIHWGEG